jgi:hypothetical protein
MKILNFFEILEILNFNKTNFFSILEFFRIGKHRAQRVLIFGINTRC